MAFLIILSGLQLLATLGVGALLWRRLDRAMREIKRLRKALSLAETQVSVTSRRHASGGDVVRSVEPPRSIGALRRTAPASTETDTAALARATAPTLSPETVRGLATATAAILPAIGFFLSPTAIAPVIATGLVVSACLMLVALRPLWRAAAWGAVLAGAAWALAGFALGAAEHAPGVFCTGVLLAGAAGLLHAHWRRAAPGVTLALLMSGAALALGVDIGLVSPAGAAFAGLVAIASTIGAMSLRLESVHLCAFAAGLIGLFAFSGQHAAAIWFTPVTAWFGAAFLGIALLRVPELGARGLTLAGTGALAAIGAVAALHASRQGLANDWAAAGAFVAVAGALAGVIVSGARRGGLAQLGLTLWVLAAGATFALSASFLVALPAPFAATAFAALAMGLAALNRWATNLVWRALSWIACGFAVLLALQSTLMLLSEARNWPSWLLILVGIALPAVLAGGAAYCAERKQAPFSAALFEAFAIAGGVIGANLALRALASGGALLLMPIGFAEAGLHVAIWLAVALLLAARAKLGAPAVRGAAIVVLGVASLLTCLVTALLWLTPHWSLRPAPLVLHFSALGFLAPALLFWAHWAFWRKQDAAAQMRTALAAGAALSAAFVTLLTWQARAGLDWVGGTVAALSFALAIGVNFAPALAGEQAPLLNFHKNFHRPRAD